MTAARSGPSSTSPSAPAGSSGEARPRAAREADPDARPFAYDGHLWRRFARFGAAHGPRWFVRASPPVIGVCAALLLPERRRAVRDNLRRVRGPVSRLRDAREVAETFATYATCFTEVLANGSKNAGTPELEVVGRGHMERAIAAGKGVILVTAHTAGWEVALPLLRAHKGLAVVMVMEPERDGGARELSDAARRAAGTEVAHVGVDPFASLPLLHRLRDGAAVALQIDRVPPGMRGVRVMLFGADGEVPEGPLRLAQLSGAPIVPIFCARTGQGRYLAEMHAPVFVPRRPSERGLEDLARVAQALASAMESFVQRHPTQWFHFGGTP